MHTKQKLLGTMAIMACSSLSFQAYAALSPNAILNFDPGVATLNSSNEAVVKSGSFFGMDRTAPFNDIKFNERTALVQKDGIFIGQTQTASGSHTGAPNGNESPGIDQPWNFVGNTGLNYTRVSVDILSDDGNGNVTLNFTGWTVTWNNVQTIPINALAWQPGFTDAVAKLTCGTDCSDGDTYTLDYFATVPDPCGGCGFENVQYQLFLTGTISVPNQPPSAAIDTLLVNAGGSATIDITTNGSDDPDGANASLTAGTFVQGLNGTTSGTGTDTITYTNDINTAASSDSFTYTVSDGIAESTPATVTVTINALPVAVNDNASTTPGGSIAIPVLNNDTDADGTLDPISVATTAATNGTLSTDTSGVVTYLNDGTTGPDSFTYTVADNNGAISSSATVTIEIETDPAPSCSGATLSPNQDTPATFDVAANATAGGAKTLDFTTIATPTTPVSGSLAIDTVTGIITYTPDAGYTGADTFSYTVNDDTLTCTAATVNINVLSTNTAPVANDDSGLISTTTVNTAVNIDIKANDTDDDELANSGVSLTNPPLNGDVNIETDGSVTYTPDTGYSGADNFTYNLTDAEGLSSLNATVSVTVGANAPSVSSGTLTPGSTAQGAGSTDARVTITDIGIPDNGSSAQQGIAQSCIGSCFDFEVTGFTGNTAQVVLPLSIAIPSTANTLLYRKLKSTGWVNFDVSGNDEVASAPGVGSGASTICPPATSDSSYATGINAGDRCLRLTIVDNGPNDNDATTGTIADPGGIAESTFIDTRTSGSDGCSLSETPVAASQRADWWLVAGFMGLLGLFRLKRKNNV